jgi:DtxR family transcriptional regulator, manganese transport regulator
VAKTLPPKNETPRLEDYLEAIYSLFEEKGYASAVDISDRLRVRPPTVTSMVQKLAKKGYLIHEPYRGMRLTESGERLARSVVSRHHVIAEFLGMIGVEAGVAYEDTEGIEHHIQPLTFRKIERLVEFLKEKPEHLKAIREYVDKK